MASSHIEKILKNNDDEKENNGGENLTRKKQKNGRRQLLDRLYKDLNSSSAFTGIEPLLREAKKQGGEVGRRLTRAQVRSYLASQPVYTLHRRVVRKYRHMPTLAPGLHTEWQCDLADFRRIARQNRGYHYLLVCIDTLSRQLFVEPVRSKHSKNMIDAFEKLFERAGAIPWKLLSDAGLEFTARPVQKFFREKEVEQFCMQTSPRFHAGMAERANRSIKERLYRYFTEHKTRRWIDVIQLIVAGINNSINSSTGMRPVDVNYANAERLRKQLKAKAEAELANGGGRWRRQRFHVGDTVRVEKQKHIFQKGYVPNFSSDVFVIDRVRLVHFQPPTYRIRDQNGKQMPGWFYANDLCPIKVHGNRKDALYDIDRVLKEEERNGVKYALVKWKGYGVQHNSWIPVNSIISK